MLEKEERMQALRARLARVMETGAKIKERMERLTVSQVKLQQKLTSEIYLLQ